jgi:hypothetical protein
MGRIILVTCLWQNNSRILTKNKKKKNWKNKNKDSTNEQYDLANDEDDEEIEYENYMQKED